MRYPRADVAPRLLQRDDTHMKASQSGTSVLAALVFVAIFVLFISGYKIASQNTGSQSAAVAAAVGAAPVCKGGEVYTVDVASGVADVDSLKCFTTDPKDPSRLILGPDNSDPRCATAAQGKCAVRYCPPSSYVTESGTCFEVDSCDPGSADCVKGSIQNASQPVQAANIIAAQLLDDKGNTIAQVPSYSGPIALADKLSDRGRSAVAQVIDETANAAMANDLDSDVIRDIGENLQNGHQVPQTSGPTAQISCQPKIAESGMKVGIAFGCANATRSEGGGFDTSGRLWGATEEQIPANLPNGTMVYALKCSDGKRAVSASCSIAVMKPFMLLSGEGSGEGAAVAWVTRGMDVCDISAPNNSELSATFVNPVPQSGAISMASVSADTEIALTCTTVGGVIKQLTTTVKASN